jgi:predicted GNAT family acetyltransferase
VAERGGGWRPALEQRIYRLDAVEHPTGVPGALRVATHEDLDLAVAWGEEFARDAGQQFGTRRSTVEAWIEHGGLFLWEDDEPRSIAVAQGRTPNGVRVGYVFTPPESRGRGYASACVAAVSQTLLDHGISFCVLYTDVSNPTSNAIYQRIGYRPIADVRDVDVFAEGAA